MKYSELVKSFDKGIDNRFILFYGKEKYLIDSFISRIQNENTKIIKVDAEEVNEEFLFSHLYSISFFNNKKIIVIDDAQKLKITKSIKSMIQDKSIQDIVVVFIAKSKDSSFRTLKNICLYVEVNSIDKSQLQKWIAREFQNRKINIRLREINLIIDKSRYFEYNSTVDLYSILMEIKKLSSSSKDRVEEIDIENSMEISLEESVFSIIESLSIKDKKGFYDKYENFLKYGGNINSLIALMVRNYSQLLLAKIFIEGNEAISKRKSVLKINSDYILRKVNMQASKKERKEIIDLLNRCLETQYLMHTMNIDKRSFIEELFLNLIK